MDINDLLAGEQVSLMLARFAPGAATRARHRGLAARFGERLAECVSPHRRLGAGAAVVVSAAAGDPGRENADG